MLFDLNGFKEGKFAVQCKTKEEAIKFLTYLNTTGLRWFSGINLTRANYWNDCKEDTCYSCKNKYKALEYSDKPFCVESKYVIYDYSDLEFENKEGV